MPALPKGCTLDSLLTPPQFAAYLGRSERWLRKRLGRMPGVIRESREVVLIHPRSYIEKRTK